MSRALVGSSQGHSRRQLLRAFALLPLLVACRRAAPAPSGTEQRLVVFAAASLRESFTAMGKAFELAHPGVAMSFNFAGTQELRTQLEHGAAVDVFASADQRHMDELAREKRVLTPVAFARNEPVIVVASESAGSISGLADLANARSVVLGASEVPIGRYSQQILARAGATLGADFRSRVEAKVRSRELNVRQVLAKVSLGEAQAGIVYRTDVHSPPPGVSVVRIPPDHNVIATYPIAVAAGAAHPALARDWLAFVLSAAGRALLRAHGFLGPEEADLLVPQ